MGTWTRPMCHPCSRQHREGQGMSACISHHLPVCVFCPTPAIVVTNKHIGPHAERTHNGSELVIFTSFTDRVVPDRTKQNEVQFHT